MAGNASYVIAQITTKPIVLRYQHGAKKSQQKVNHKKRRLKVLSTNTVASVIERMVFGLQEKVSTQQQSTDFQEIDQLQHQQLHRQNQKQD